MGSLLASFTFLRNWKKTHQSKGNESLTGQSETHYPVTAECYIFIPQASASFCRGTEGRMIRCMFLLENNTELKAEHYSQPPHSLNVSRRLAAQLSVTERRVG